MTERPTWIYLSMWRLKDRVGMIVGFEIEEVRGLTSAPASDHERKALGFWRTDQRRTDAELEQWARQRWAETHSLGMPLEPEITITRSEARW